MGRWRQVLLSGPSQESGGCRSAKCQRMRRASSMLGWVGRGLWYSSNLDYSLAGTKTSWFWGVVSLGQMENKFSKCWFDLGCLVHTVGCATMEVASSPDLGLKCGGELVLREKNLDGSHEQRKLILPLKMSLLLQCRSSLAAKKPNSHLWLYLHHCRKLPLSLTDTTAIPSSPAQLPGEGMTLILGMAVLEATPWCAKIQE